MPVSNVSPGLLVLSRNAIANVFIYHNQASSQLNISATDFDDAQHFFINPMKVVPLIHPLLFPQGNYVFACVYFFLYLFICLSACLLAGLRQNY